MNPFDAERTAAHIEGNLRALAAPARAEAETRYLKSELDHLGVTVWQIRREVKAFGEEHPSLSHTEFIALVQALWSRPVHERRMAAAMLLETYPTLIAATGKVVSFPLNPSGPNAHEVASGYSLLVDVESGPDGALYALSQGDSPGNVPPASPAAPDSGRLLLVNRNGSFSVLVDELDLPTSLDFAGDTAFVTTLNGEVWKITNVSRFIKQ